MLIYSHKNDKLCGWYEILKFLQVLGHIRAFSNFFGEIFGPDVIGEKMTRFWGKIVLIFLPMGKVYLLDLDFSGNWECFSFSANWEKFGTENRTQILSHLLIAGCDIGVQISVRPFVRPSVNINVEV